MRCKSIPFIALRESDRFWLKVDRSGGPDACHPWMGSRTRDGYGQSRVGAVVTYRAHRVAYFLATGDDPATPRRNTCIGAITNLVPFSSVTVVSCSIRPPSSVRRHRQGRLSHRDLIGNVGGPQAV